MTLIFGLLTFKLHLSLELRYFQQVLIVYDPCY